MKPGFRLKRDERGVAATEFALVAPVFLAMIFAAIQLGVLFFANAGLNNAVAEGARLASLYPRPTDEQIKTKIGQKRFGLDPEYLSAPDIVNGRAADGADYAEITMTYSAPIDFIFYEVGPITLRQTRRVYTHPTS